MVFFFRMFFLGTFFLECFVDGLCYFFEILIVFAFQILCLS